MSKNPKVVLNCSLKENKYYSEDGKFHHKIESLLDSKIDYKVVIGDLVQQNLELEYFKKECEHADVVITTAYPPYESWKSKSKDPHRRRDFYNDSGNTWLKKIAHIFMDIQKRNPTAFYFASLFQGSESYIHQYAKPFNNSHEEIIKALKQKQIEFERFDLYERLVKSDIKPRILIVDDSMINLEFAKVQFDDLFLTVINSYLEAIQIIRTADKSNKQFDVVMTDLLMPSEDANQGREIDHGKEMAVGSLIAHVAIEYNVPTICVLSDARNAEYPIVKVAEMMTKKGPVKWFCGKECPTIRDSNGSLVKDWKKVLKSLESISQ